MYKFLNLSSVLAHVVGVATAHAQTWSQTSTSLLVATSESNLASGFTTNLPIVIPITIGVALVMFFLGWLLSRISGKH